jgi:MerR family transcriptional regulator/heat shock protein HspR
MNDRARPRYTIGVVADMLKIHPQTLRVYEKKGLLRPSRSEGRTRLYSEEDIEELGRLIRLTRDLGVNLAGVEIVLRMRRRMMEMQKQIEDLLSYIRETSDGPPEREPRQPREALVRAASGQLSPVDVLF